MVQRMSARDAAARIQPRDTLGLPLGTGQPPDFLHALGERDDFESLEVAAGLLMDLFPLFARRGVRLSSGFFGPVERALQAAGHSIDFVPGDFRGFQVQFERRAPRVMATAATAPDAQGRLSLGLHAGATVDELRRAGRDPQRLLIVEIVPGLPRTLGLPPLHPHALDLAEVDVLIEGSRPPLALPDPVPTEVDRAIARHAQRFIAEGATLQTGIGSIPSQIAELLAQGPGGDYGIHSEMFTDGLMQLHEAGKVGNHKGLHDGYSVCTFAAGSRELYAWLDGNPAVRFLPVSAVNAPEAIGANRRMVSINGALMIDLHGQVVADSIGGRQYSGIGGHLEFVDGSAHAPGGRSLLCLPATFGNGSARSSRIVAELPPGSLVTTPRHAVDVVITQHGAAELAGLSDAERRAALLAICEPDLRAGLEAAAEAARAAVNGR